MRILSLTLLVDNDDEVDRKIANCIERVLARYDEKVSRVIFSKFEADYNLQKSDISRNPELFAKTVKSVLRFGSFYVERAMAAELRSTFALGDAESLGLVDVVCAIKASKSLR